MNVGEPGSVLLVGGSGGVGRRAARALRHLQPPLPLLIGVRDASKASARLEVTRND